MVLNCILLYCSMKKIITFGLASFILLLQVTGQSKRRGVTSSDMKTVESLVSVLSTATPLKQRNILVFEKNTGWKSPAIAFVDSALVAMSRITKAFTIVAITEDDSYFSAEKLAFFDAVVLNNTNELLLNRQQSSALQNFVKSGKGVFALGAAISVRNWPEHAEMLGGSCLYHPFERNAMNTANKWAFSVDDSSHPLTLMYSPEGFKEVETVYQLYEPYWRSNVRVLLSLDRSDVATGSVNRTIFRNDKDFAVAWIKEYGKGRVFFSQFTHINPDVVFNKAHLQHFLSALQFVLGDMQLNTKPVTPKGKTDITVKYKNLAECKSNMERSDISARIDIAYSLGRMEPKPEVLQLLIQLLQDSVSEVRYFAGLSGARYGKLYTDAVEKLLESQNPVVKGSAIQALGFFGLNAGNLVTRIQPFVNDKDISIRLTAISAFGRISPDKGSAVEVLTGLLKDSIPEVRQAVFETLAEMGTSAQSALPLITRFIQTETNSRARRSATNVAVSLAGLPQAKDAVIAITSLLEADWQLAMRGVICFRELGINAKPALPRLISLTGDSRPETRLYAALCMGEVGQVLPEVIPVLVKLLNDKEQMVKYSAADALHKIGEKARGPLSAMLSSNDWYLRLKAVQTFSKMGAVAKDLLPQIEKLMNDPDPEVCRAAGICVENLKRI